MEVERSWRGRPPEENVESESLQELIAQEEQKLAILRETQELFDSPGWEHIEVRLHQLVKRTEDLILGGLAETVEKYHFQRGRRDGLKALLDFKDTTKSMIAETQETLHDLNGGSA